LEITVRGGGHSYAGACLTDDGLMIDLSRMRGVHVDPDARIARCGGGASWADVDGATQQFGLAVPGGMISHTGIGGLTLGGGIGWLTRRHGLVIDNLLAAEVVLADGAIVRASAEEHPDLFWALRGGGGNFGVVTEFEYRLHPIGPEIQFGLFFWPLDQTAEALRLSRDTIHGLNRDATGFIAPLNAPPESFVPEEYHLLPGTVLIIVGFGSAEEHAALVAPVREALPPLFELVTPMPYVALQQVFDAGFAWGIRAYTKSLYLEDLTDDAIAVIAEHLPAKRSPMTTVPIFMLGGAFRDVDDADTAFGGSRSACCWFVIDGLAPDAQTLAAERMWTRGLWQALRPLAVNAGGYVNAMAEYEENVVRESYGPKYDRLARIKAEYDPGNVLHHNANIKPA
ncbi:FAD-binding oxidoreductase, partial [Pseudonocardia acidicola]